MSRQQTQAEDSKMTKILQCQIWKILGSFNSTKNVFKREQKYWHNNQQTNFRNIIEKRPQNRYLKKIQWIQGDFRGKNNLI